ncbi:hypothetical protein MJO29_014626 [Puccinia striiformis f. sp. tritici]|nr:hypothetical protein MJO29_014626 [Puccinia striiformis f. sp. tritici]
MTDSPSGSPAAIKECAGSGTPSRICRFQTIPPLPFLKAAITISEEWTIERLIEKIHGTIRSEADHREFLDLLEGPNPSHRLLLELSDGCRLPTTEPCSVIHEDQVVSLRLFAKQQPQPRSRPLDHVSFHRVASQPINFPYIPSPITPQSHFPDLLPHVQWRETLNHRSSSPGHASLFLNRSFSSAQPYQGSSEQGPPQVDRGAEVSMTHNGDYPFSTGISSPQLFHRFTQEPHERHTQLDVTQTGNQRLLGNGRRFTSLPAHQLDADNLSQAPTSYRPQHDFYTGYETVPRLQNFGATHHSSTEQSFSASNADYVPTAQHTLEFPYRSSSPSEEPKPTIEELDRSTRLERPSGPGVARVRSHIAAFRKSASRHYRPSDSGSSSNDSSSSSEESDDLVSFSRHGRNFNTKPSPGQSHSRKVQKKNPQSRKVSTRHSFGGILNKRGVSSRPRRKSVPVRFELSSGDDAEVQQSGTNRGQSQKSSKAKRPRDESPPPSDRSKSPSTSPRDRPKNQSPPHPRKKYISQQVRVVIPVIPGLSSPAYLRHKQRLAERSKLLPIESVNPPPSSGGSLDRTGSPSTNSKNLTSQDGSPDTLVEPAQLANSSTSVNPPSKNLSTQDHPSVNLQNPIPQEDPNNNTQNPSPQEEPSVNLHNPSPQEDISANLPNQNLQEDLSDNPQNPNLQEDSNSNTQNPSPQEDISANLQNPSIQEDPSGNLQNLRPQEDLSDNLQNPNLQEDANSNTQNPSLQGDSRSNTSNPSPQEDLSVNLQDPSPQEDPSANLQNPSPHEDLSDNLQNLSPQENPSDDLQNPRLQEDISDNLQNASIQGDPSDNLQNSSPQEDFNSNTRNPSPQEDPSDNVQNPSLQEDSNSNTQNSSPQDDFNSNTQNPSPQEDPSDNVQNSSPQKDSNSNTQDLSLRKEPPEQVDQPNLQSVNMGQSQSFNPHIDPSILKPQAETSGPVDEPCQRESVVETRPTPASSPAKRDRPTKSCSPAKSCSPTKPELSRSLSVGRAVRSVYPIHIHDVKFKSASAQGPQRIPYSSNGLNESSTLRQVIDRLNLDMQTSWKLIIGDKVWLSEASTSKRAQLRRNDKKFGGLLDGRIVQIDWQLSLKELGVLPLSNVISDLDIKPLRIEIIRNWDV